MESNPGDWAGVFGFEPIDNPRYTEGASRPGVADFYLGETESHLQWAVRRIPIRKDNQGRDVNLTAILQAFENSQLTQLKQVLDRKDKPGFERVSKESPTVCCSCHKAADKPYLRPRVPTEPETRIMNFDPKADWPL